MIDALIKDATFDNILDIGYGSGIFFPELKKHSSNLFGIDIHEYHTEIQKRLFEYGIEVNLSKANIDKLPFTDNFFECIIAISVLEHIKNLEKTLLEILRVLKPNGIFLVGIPIKNKFMNLIFKNLLRFQSDRYHLNSHIDVIVGIQKFFRVLETRKFPYFLPIDSGFYIALKSIKA